MTSLHTVPMAWDLKAHISRESGALALGVTLPSRVQQGSLMCGANYCIGRLTIKMCTYWSTTATKGVLINRFEQVHVLL